MRESIALPEFFTVVGIRVDIYESTIEDEKHFENEDQAREYATDLQRAGLVTIIAAL